MGFGNEGAKRCGKLEEDEDQEEKGKGRWGKGVNVGKLAN